MERASLDVWKSKKSLTSVFLRFVLIVREKGKEKKCEYYQHLNDQNHGKNCPYVPFIGDFVVHSVQI